MPRVRRIRVTDRDVETLATIGELGIVDRGLCHSLCFASYSAEWCRQNLARLVAAGLVRATGLQVWHDEEGTGGRVPLLFSLTEAGAEVLYTRRGTYPRRVLRSEPSPSTFWHRLWIVRVRVAFDRAAKIEGLPPLNWIHEQDLRPDAPSDAMPHRRRVLYHEFHDTSGHVVTCRPDAAATLAIPHPNGAGTQASTLAIHFEIDRSREGLAQCQRKIPGYAMLFERRSFATYWPDSDSAVHRVFWIAPSRQRIEQLTTAFESFPVAACFRFATFDDMQPDRVLTQPIWCDLSGARMTLYRKVAATLNQK